MIPAVVGSSPIVHPIAMVSNGGAQSRRRMSRGVKQRRIKNASTESRRAARHRKKHIMQVSIETTSALERRLTISVPSEEFEDQITTKLTEARSQVRLPGFRPGKVPLKEVRRRFGQGVRAEVASELMQSTFFDAVAQEKMSPAGQPSLEVVKMDPGIDFEFTATFEVMPVIELREMGDLEVLDPQAEITDEDMETVIQRMREQKQSREAVERPAQKDDEVTLDFSGTVDGEPFEGGAAEDFKFVVGVGQMIEDFDNAVLGMSAGDDKTFDAVFPEDYRAEELQGKTAQFEVSVKSIAESVLPELDDEFFKEFGVEEGGEEAFRKEVRENMDRELANAARNQVKEQVLEGLKDAHDFQLPHAMVHREVHVLKDQMLQQFQMYGGGQNNTPDLPDSLFEEQAESRVKLGLLMNAVIEKAEIEPDEAKVTERLEELAKPYQDPEAIIRYYRSDEQQMQQIEMSVLEDQGIDWLLAQCQVKALDSNYTDIINGTAIPKPEVPEAEAAAGEAEPSDSAETSDVADVAEVSEASATEAKDN